MLAIHVHTKHRFDIPVNLEPDLLEMLYASWALIIASLEVKLTKLLLWLKIIPYPLSTALISSILLYQH